MVDQSRVERLLARYQGYLHSHGRHTAVDLLMDDGADYELAEAVAAQHARRLGPIVVSAPALTDDSIEHGWIDSRLLSDRRRPRWIFTRSSLDVPEGALEVVDRTTDEILSLLPDPAAPQIFGRGLVVGYVQSGKTTNFTALAAKAADAGYNLIIVLGGIHTSLRRQTQERVQHALFHKPEMWWTSTRDGDFRSSDGGTPLASRQYGPGKCGLLVVKKHRIILGYLADWLWSAGPGVRTSTRVLVIDDEADQAGLDVSSGPELEGVHEQLMRIVNLGDGPSEANPGNRRVAYVGYTATPYANVLTRADEENLYPRHFIYPLPKPASHVGPADLFGDAVVGRPVKVVTKEPGDDGGGWRMGRDLERAIDWFVLVTAARSHLMGGPEKLNSTMLIHTGRQTDEHRQVRGPVLAYLSSLRDRIAVESELDELRSKYGEEVVKVSAEALGEVRVEWDDLRPHLTTVVDRLVDAHPAGDRFREDGKWQQARSGVIVDNSQEDSEDRLTYPRQPEGVPGVTIIAIGGDTLSRGLTLEGLCVSFFARTSGNYDSLMQMGRWFGFRRGYQHLTRLWTTPVLWQRFRRLTEVEEKFREELDWMIREERSPSEYGPKILLDPDMQVTRRSAIRSAMATSSWADYTASMTALLIDEESVAANQLAVRELVDELPDPVPLNGGPSHLAIHVSGEAVSNLLQQLRVHPEDYRMHTNEMRRYIEEAGLTDWNVVVRSISSSSSTFWLGAAIGDIGTVIRSQVRGAMKGGAYIQTLLDTGDGTIDLDDAPSPSHRGHGDPPLLLIYFIDALSAPRKMTKTNADRVPLNAPDTVPAIGVVFPPSHDRPTIQWAGVAR